jgi:DNA replication licensing factor MCM7
LATALARLRIVGTVEKEDVNEAMRLMEMSKDSLNLGNDERTGKKSVIDRIYDVIREMRAGHTRTLKMAEITERCTSKGFKPDQINEAIEAYENLNVFAVNDARSKITFVDAN